MGNDNDNNNPTWYPIPDDVAVMYVDYAALMEWRDSLAGRVLGYKWAKRAAIDAARLRKEFWNKVRDIYPEFDDHQLAFNEFKGIRPKSDVE